MELVKTKNGYYYAMAIYGTHFSQTKMFDIHPMPE